MIDSRHKGELAQLRVQMRAAEKGWLCSRPTMDGARYDLILDDGERLFRVQVKYANGVTSHCSGAVRVGLVRRNSGGRGMTRTYDRHEVDALLVFAPTLDKVLWIPPTLFEHRRALNIRCSDAKNGQRKGIIHAEEFEW